jgi:hypothetical protein
LFLGTTVLTTATLHSLLNTEGKTVTPWMKSTALGQTDEWMVFGDHQLTTPKNVN